MSRLSNRLWRRHSCLPGLRALGGVLVALSKTRRQYWQADVARALSPAAPTLVSALARFQARLRTACRAGTLSKTGESVGQPTWRRHSCLPGRTLLSGLGAGIHAGARNFQARLRRLGGASVALSRSRRQYWQADVARALSPAAPTLMSALAGFQARLRTLGGASSTLAGAGRAPSVFIPCCALPVLALLLPFLLFAQPARIVSTSPSVTETLFALGLGDRVVGVSNYCHYPPEVSTRPRVGTWLKPNAEVIARLRPDLVLVQRLPNDVAEQLRALKVRVAVVDNGDLARNLESMREIGRAAGVPDRADALVFRIRSDLDEIRKRMQGRSRRALFVVGRMPGKLEGIVGVGSKSYISELMEIAGAVNVLGSTRTDYTRVSLEAIVRLDPEVLVDMGEMAETTGITEERKQSVVRLWQSQSTLAAVRSRRVYAVADDIYVVPGPRMVHAARELARLIHPEAAR